MLNLQIKNWKSKIFSKEELKSFTHEFSLQFNKTKLAEKTKIINFSQSYLKVYQVIFLQKHTINQTNTIVLFIMTNILKKLKKKTSI